MNRTLVVGTVLVLGGCAGSILQDFWRGPTSSCAWQVCVHPTVSGERVVFHARNAGPVVATVSLTFEVLQNLRLTDSVPVVRTVPAGSSVVLTHLVRVASGALVNARPIVRVDLGSDSTRPDPAVLYSMPFGGSEPRALVGGYGSPTHLAENFYALDFAMPEGTPVLAARGGVVLLVQDGFTEGGLRPELLEKVNLVVVVHSDGTLASYGHLRPGLAVAEGDSVVTGQRLGSSGASGFAGQPHLHFHVGTRLMGGEGRTIPVRFRSPSGEIRAPLEGVWYLPAGGTGGPAPLTPLPDTPP